jgi:hypothetical protein
MFPVTGNNFIHTCMHVHIVFAGVRVCVRAGRRVCVCGKQIHTHSSRELPSVAAGAGSGARLRCQTRELPSVAAGALSRACDICTHVITHNSLQVSTSLYIKMTLLRALVIKIIGMYVCMYVGTYIYITPQVSPPIIFAMEKRWGKKNSHLAREAYQVCACVRAIYTLLITHNSVQVFTSLYIKMTLLQALLITFICMYVCMYVCTHSKCRGY